MKKKLLLLALIPAFAVGSFFVFKEDKPAELYTSTTPEPTVTITDNVQGSSIETPEEVVEEAPVAQQQPVQQLEPEPAPEEPVQTEQTVADVLRIANATDEEIGCVVRWLNYHAYFRSDKPVITAQTPHSFAQEIGWYTRFHATYTSRGDKPSKVCSTVDLKFTR